MLEMMVVVVIIAILIGFAAFSASLSRQKAKAVRWLAYNEMLNRDPDTVINFNFQDPGFQRLEGGVLKPALANRASGCTISGFNLDEYHGLIRDAQWVRGGGRSRHHHALQFDGRRSYVEILGVKALDLDPAADDLTIMMWVRMDTASGTRGLCAKAEWPQAAQFDLYLNGTRLQADLGTVAKGWRTPAIAAKQWYHVALVLENQGGGRRTISAFLNGAPMSRETTPATSVIATRTATPLLLGGVWAGAGLPRYLFQGRMDEFVLIRRALKPEEVAAHYRIGLP